LIRLFPSHGTGSGPAELCITVSGGKVGSGVGGGWRFKSGRAAVSPELPQARTVSRTTINVRIAVIRIAIPKTRPRIKIAG